MKNDYMTVSEAASLCGVTPLTIRNWDARGRLVSYRHPINNYRMFRKSDIEALMANIKPSPKKGPRKLAVKYEDEIA